MCNMLAELIETMQGFTSRYLETCCEKKVSTKFDASAYINNDVVLKREIWACIMIN